MFLVSPLSLILGWRKNNCGLKVQKPHLHQPNTSSHFFIFFIQLSVLKMIMDIGLILEFL